MKYEPLALISISAMARRHFALRNRRARPPGQPLPLPTDAHSVRSWAAGSPPITLRAPCGPFPRPKISLPTSAGCSTSWIVTTRCACRHVTARACARRDRDARGHRSRRRPARRRDARHPAGHQARRARSSRARSTRLRKRAATAPTSTSSSATSGASLAWSGSTTRLTPPGRAPRSRAGVLRVSVPRIAERRGREIVVPIDVARRLSLMRLLFVGDIVGKPGRTILARALPPLGASANASIS